MKGESKLIFNALLLLAMALTVILTVVRVH
jgi:hypothetical protein